MDARLRRYPDNRDGPTQIADSYRVALWEQPQHPDIDPERLGWHEMTFDLDGAQDVREAIEWAEAKLAADEGPLSQDGVAVQDREYRSTPRFRGTTAGCTSQVGSRPVRLICRTI